MQELQFLHSAHRLMLIDICMKFREDSFRGFQVTERTRFVTDRQTDIRTPGEKQYVSQPFGGRHNYAPAEELRLIQGVGYRIAEIILYLREMHGNIGSDLLSNLLRKPLPPSVLKYLDFSHNPAYQGGGEGREASWEGPSTPRIWGRVEEHVGVGMDLLNLGTSQETDQIQNVYKSSAFGMASGMVDSSTESVPSMMASKMVDPIPNYVKSKMEPKIDATSSLKLEDISPGEETSKKTNRGQQMKTLQ